MTTWVRGRNKIKENRDHECFWQSTTTLRSQRLCPEHCWNKPELMYTTLMSSLVCSDPGELGLLSNRTKLFLPLISKRPNKPQKEKQFPVMMRIFTGGVQELAEPAATQGKRGEESVSAFKTAIGKI